MVQIMLQQFRQGQTNCLYNSDYLERRQGEGGGQFVEVAVEGFVLQDDCVDLLAEVVSLGLLGVDGGDDAEMAVAEEGALPDELVEAFEFLRIDLDWEGQFAVWAVMFPFTVY